MCLPVSTIGCREAGDATGHGGMARRVFTLPSRARAGQFESVYRLFGWVVESNPNGANPFL